jgi:hypothetical protein
VSSAFSYGRLEQLFFPEFMEAKDLQENDEFPQPQHAKYLLQEHMEALRP